MVPVFEPCTSSILGCSILGEFKYQTALDFRWSTVALILEILYASISLKVEKLWSSIAPVLKKPYMQVHCCRWRRECHHVCVT